MNRERLEKWRIGIFVFGLVLILLAFLMFEPSMKEVTARHWFAWFDLTVVYAIVFGSVLFTTGIRRMRTERFIGLGIEWSAIIIYALCSLILIFGSFMELLPLAAAVLIQGAALFLLLLSGFYANLTVRHAAEVNAAQEDLLNPILELRAAAKTLALKAQSLPPDYKNAADKLCRISEELAYLTPVQKKQAYALEDQILAGLKSLSAMLPDEGGVVSSAFLKQADAVLFMIAQRKQLLN